jgi:hypothetical protein
MEFFLIDTTALMEVHICDDCPAHERRLIGSNLV